MPEFIDQMVEYASRRKARFGSYSLSNSSFKSNDDIGFKDNNMSDKKNTTNHMASEREPFTLYTVGYEDTCPISVRYCHGVSPQGYIYEKIESIRFNYSDMDFNPTKIDGEPLCELFLDEEDAQYLIEDIIENKNEIKFDNGLAGILDGEQYAPENLKIFKMPIIPVKA